MNGAEEDEQPGRAAQNWCGAGELILDEVAGEALHHRSFGAVKNVVH